MEEEGGLSHLCALLQAAALEYAKAGVDVGNAEEGVQEEFCLSDTTLSELLGFFQAFDPSSSDIAGVWEELADKNVSAGGIVKILTSTMDGGGMAGIKAVNLYLCLLLVPGWPVYSLFSQMAFDGLARCLRNSCKPVSKAAVGQESVKVDGERGVQRKGKRPRKPGRGRQAMADDELEGDGQQSHTAETAECVSVECVMSLLAKLQRAVLLLHLEERQETLKLIVGLLVDMLHLLSDLTEGESGRTENGGREKKRPGSTSRRNSVPEMVFSTLQSLLDERHGQPLTTAIIILRALTPTILLTHTVGVCKGEMRNETLNFVIHSCLREGFSSIRPAVAALPRYICFKAPEKTDARSLAVESLTTVLKASTSNEWCTFTDFLCKHSHSKPRHRLFAVDVSLALLAGLPNPLNPGYAMEPPTDATANDRPGNSRSGVEAQIGIDEDEYCDREEENAHSDAAGPSNQGNPPVPERQWWSITCFEILLHRCSDKVPAIRARSLTNLSQAIELVAVDVVSRRHIQVLLGFTGNLTHLAPRSNVGIPTRHPSNICDTPILGGETPSADPSLDLPSATPLTPGAGHRDLWSLLQRRCLDDKAAVRKAAFQLMMKSTVLLGKAPDDAILAAVGGACDDPMISIRKVALSALSEVFRRFPGDAKVGKEWLKSALPLAFDNEQSLQDECLNLFEELVLDRICLISNLNKHRGNKETLGGRRHERQELDSLLPAGTVNTLKEIADGSTISSCVKRICTSLGKKKRVSPGVALALQTLISSNQASEGAWFLLAEVTAFVPKAVGWEFLRTHWELLEKSDNSSTGSKQAQEHETEAFDGDKAHGESAAWAANRVHLLQTISNVAIELPPDAAADLATELLGRLEAFNMHPAEVGAHINSLAILCRRKALTAKEGDQLVVHWAKDLLERAGNILQDTISPSFSAHDGGGDVPFQTPQTTTGRKSLGRQTSSRRTHSSSAGNERGMRHGRKNASTPQLETVIFTVGALALLCPQVKADHAVTLLQTLLTHARGLLKHQNVVKADILLLKDKVTPEVTVQVLVALGKLCLADDALAKRCIPFFVQELGRKDSAAVRNNIMIIITDFCVRYTALIDGYMHDLTRSLRDSSEIVRRQAFVLLSRLLQRDYVKWRGTLFHRFLLSLVDESEKISELAKFVFGSALKSKAPLLAYNSFVEAIFVLNDCCSQASSSALLQIPETERALFSLRGDADAVVEKRMRIYSTLLQQMLPEHLLATSARLCADILAAAADGLLDVNDGPSRCVLQDGLRILALKELRICGTRANAGNADAEEEDGGAAAAMAAVKGRVVTQLMKKNLVQNAVPIFIELKRLLESMNSPLLGLLMECMRVMLKDYKNEIEEILVADKQLLKEILYDMQKHKAEKARAKVAAVAVAIPIHQDAPLPSPSAAAFRTPLSTHRRRNASAPEPLTSNALNKSGDDPRSKKSGQPKGKENMFLSPHGISNSGSVFRIPNSAAQQQRRAHGEGDGFAEPPPQFAWPDRTPRTRIFSAIPASLSRLNASGPRRTPFAAPPSHTSGPSHFWQAPLQVPITKPITLSQETCLADAVADVAAATTVATVLKQVAHKSATPLRGMSLPRLHPSVSNISSALGGQKTPISSQVPTLQDPRPRAEPVVGPDSSLEAVRRRQSFSSVGEPCGLPSQSDD